MKKLIISPQAGFGNRLRALCAGKVFGLMTGREVYHFWVTDSEYSHAEHVNNMKNIDPTYFFDLQIPLFDGKWVDTCFTEWMPDDYWHREQATAQTRLQCGRVVPIPDVSEIANCSDDVILVETSLELHLPNALMFRHTLMGEVYQEYFRLAQKWLCFSDALPCFDNGIAVRRQGGFIANNPESKIDMDHVCVLVGMLTGTKIIFSDDGDYLEKLRFLTNCPLGINGMTKMFPTTDYDFTEFLILSKCGKIFGTPNSSFAEQAAIFGRKPYESIRAHAGKVERGL